MTKHEFDHKIAAIVEKIMQKYKIPGNYYFTLYWFLKELKDYARANAVDFQQLVDDFLDNLDPENIDYSIERFRRKLYGYLDYYIDDEEIVEQQIQDLLNAYYYGDLKLHEVLKYLRDLAADIWRSGDKRLFKFIRKIEQLHDYLKDQAASEWLWRSQFSIEFHNNKDKRPNRFGCFPL